MKICFVSDVHYPNYTKRIQESALKCFLDLGLHKYDFHYYISTNRPNDLIHLDGKDNVKIFDIDILRGSNFNSINHEILPNNPIGTYPSKFPYNLRRFIIEKAAMDGFDYVIFLDADVMFREIVSIDNFVENVISKYLPNCVKTNVHIFDYSKDTKSEVFSLHEKYFNFLNYDFSQSNLNTLDGPVMVFMGETNQDILKFVNIWHNLTDFGYEKKFGFGYDNNFIANLSFVIAMSGFKLQPENFPWYPNHIFEDRYDVNYVPTEGEFDYLEDNSVNVQNQYTQKSLSEIFNQYSCKKSKNGFSELIEPYLNYINNSNCNILEIGVGTISLDPPQGMNHVPENMYSWKQNNPDYFPGNSLRSFRDFLETGFIFGIDIQDDCKIDEERITTFIFDSRDPFACEKYLSDKKFDLIIDDSDKDANIRILTFNNLYKLLNNDGYYILEGLIDLNFLEKYFNYSNINYFIYGDFLVISKNSDFEHFKHQITKPITQNHNYEIEIIDYKEIIQNTPNFSIQGVKLADKGFYINLKGSDERRKNVEFIVDKYKIEGLVRFGALQDEMIQYSCTKSHIGVFKVAQENNLETIFVAEDDFDISETLYSPMTESVNFKNKISAISEDLNKLDWDVFLFGCNPKSHLIPITENVAVVDKSTGAWAYLIKRSAYDFLIHKINYKKDYIAIDDYLPLLNDLGFVTLTSIPLTIGHSVGFVSTLQPKGPVNYTDWINGNYHKFLFDNYKNGNFNEDTIEKNLTICIPGFFCDNYLFHLKYALKTLPDELKKCKILVRFDTSTKTPDLTEFIKLQAYFRDVHGLLNVTLTYGFGGLIASFDYFLKTIRTELFMMYEFDYLFLDKEKIDFMGIIQSFKNHRFVNTVYFSGDDISVRGFDLSTDKNGVVTPFELESRVKEINLVTTTRWSNRPAIHRLSKMREWFDKYMKNPHIGELHQSCYGLEDSMIPVYKNDIENHSWEDIKDNWGTYLYGNIGEGPFVAHTDSSKRYQNENKSALEINAETYVLEHPLTDYD